MIGYNEAYEKAKALKDNIDKCVEYDTAYMFVSNYDEFKIGGDGPVIIMKDNWRAVGQTYYYSQYEANEVKEFNI